MDPISIMTMLAMMAETGATAATAAAPAAASAALPAAAATAATAAPAIASAGAPASALGAGGPAGGLSSSPGLGARFLPALQNMFKNSSFKFGNDQFSVGVGPSPQRKMQQSLQLLQQGGFLDDLFGQQQNNPMAMSRTNGRSFSSLPSMPRLA